MDAAAWPDPDVEPTGDKVRVLIVHEHRFVAEGIAVVLDTQPDMAAVAVATSTEMAGRFAGVSPDLVVIDVGSDDPTGAGVAQVGRVFPGAKLVVLTQEDAEPAAIAAPELSARAFILKSHRLDDLIRTLRRVARGDIVYQSPHSIRRVVERRARRNAAGGRLSAREKEVLQLLATGMASRQIGRELGIGYTTVRAHVQRVLHKLGAHSKIQAVLRGRDLGLVE